MSTKHVNAAKKATSQKAQQSAARKQAQAQRGSAKFRQSGGNPHHGAPISNTGHRSR